MGRPRPEPDFAASAYARAKSVWKGIPIRSPSRIRARTGDQSVPFGRGRDPRALGELLASTAQELGWTGELDQARLISEWPRFAGASIAQHTSVVGMGDGVLVVQCDSTTWATELRRLRGEILTRILEEYPDIGLRELKFLAPGAPSWRHGPRRVAGRGPRDTYG